MAGNVIERYFMVCEENNENSAQYGPYKTAEEAEAEAARLGFDWIHVTTKTVDEYGHTIDMKTRFYQTGSSRIDKTLGRIDDKLDFLRKKLAPVVKPMTEEEEKFFAEYEKQITYVCAECGEEIAPGEVYASPIEHMDGTSETVYFHSDLKRSCPLKWSSKKLIAAGEKLRKILEMFDEPRRPS